MFRPLFWIVATAGRGDRDLVHQGLVVEAVAGGARDEHAGDGAAPHEGQAPLGCRHAVVVEVGELLARPLAVGVVQRDEHRDGVHRATSQQIAAAT